MASKAINIWSFVCVLLTIAILVFLANLPLNCPANATAGVLDSVLRLFCR
jgi:hypothetical protein